MVGKHLNSYYVIILSFEDDPFHYAGPFLLTNG
jgi:hypothetical protein